MVFSDLFFLFAFLPAVLICYALAGIIDKRLLSTPLNHSNQAKNITLVFFSLIFYAWGEPVYVFLMLFCVLANYLFGLLISNSNKRRKLALIAALICNLSILGTFKYLGFFANILAEAGIPVSPPQIALPIGISFYTFQSISYIIDVYQRKSPAQRKFLGLLLYISMFPQLIAGPIVRYNTVADEINNRKISTKDIAEGLYRFLIGLGKKVIIANQLSEISDQFLATNDLSQLSTAGAWVGIFAFMLQIYFDFSGYSDMAIGLGRILGFHFNENFRHPYCCNSITDFWRRWHISLGSFFRDYLYIPMGGNRRHQAINIFVVWFLTGMWHGASWNFIIWGVYFGLIVAIEKYTVLRLKQKAWQPLLHIYSLLLVITGWGIFYFDDFSKMQSFFAAYFGHGQMLTDFNVTAALTDNFWLWVVAIILCMPVRHSLASATEHWLQKWPHFKDTFFSIVRIGLSAAILILSTALLVGATNNAFIYTRF